MVLWKFFWLYLLLSCLFLLYSNSKDILLPVSLTTVKYCLCLDLHISFLHLPPVFTQNVIFLLRLCFTILPLIGHFPPLSSFLAYFFFPVALISIQYSIYLPFVIIFTVCLLLLSPHQNENHMRAKIFLPFMVCSNARVTCCSWYSINAYRFDLNDLATMGYKLYNFR